MMVSSTLIFKDVGQITQLGELLMSCRYPGSSRIYPGSPAMGQLTRCQDGATSGPQRFLKPVVKVVLAWALAQMLGPKIFGSQ